MSTSSHPADHLQTVGPVRALSDLLTDETMLALMASDGYGSEVQVQLVCLPLDFVVQEFNPCVPEDYLFDIDVEEEESQEAYHLVLDLCDAYADDPGSVEPIVIGRSIYNAQQTTLYDGYHRCCAAAHAKAEYVHAYLIVSLPETTSQSPV